MTLRPGSAKKLSKSAAKFEEIDDVGDNSYASGMSDSDASDYEPLEQVEIERNNLVRSMLARVFFR